MIRKLSNFNFKQIINQRVVVTSRFYSEKAGESTNYTHFGYESVKTDEKTEKGKTKNSNDDFRNFSLFLNLFVVHKVFENVAEKYDIMNDAMSMGVHRIWKDILLERFFPTLGTVRKKIGTF